MAGTTKQGGYIEKTQGLSSSGRLDKTCSLEMCQRDTYVLRILTQTGLGAGGFRLLRGDAIESRIRRGRPQQQLFSGPFRPFLVLVIKLFSLSFFLVGGHTAWHVGS